MPIYVAFNGPEPTTAARVAVTTGTAVKTMLQVATPANAAIRALSWGISFDGSAAATPGIVELIETDVAATVTTLTPSKYSDPGSAVSLCVGGVAATGYTATAEGTITAVRTADVQHIAPTSQYVYEWVLEHEFVVARSKFLRVRVDMVAAVNAICWIRWMEL